jgi:hypothetical protein
MPSTNIIRPTENPGKYIYTPNRFNAFTKVEAGNEIKSVPFGKPLLHIIEDANMRKRCSKIDGSVLNFVNKKTPTDFIFADGVFKE